MYSVKNIFLLIFICGNSCAWANQNSKVIHFNEKKGMRDIMEYCYFSLDSKGHNDGLPNDSSFFDASERNLEKLGERYWMRFTLHNSEDKWEEIQLFPGLSEELYLFVPTKEGVKKYSIGTFESRSKVKAIAGHGKTFLAQAMVSLQPNETKTFYAYFYHKSGGQQAKRDSKIAPRIMEGNAWLQKNILVNLIWSFVFGCFIILILYHFVYFFLTKDFTYLYYCLFIFAVSFPFFTLVIDVVDLPQYGVSLFFTVSGLFSVFYFQFTRNLIHLNVLLPKWDKLLKMTILIKVVLVILYTVGYQIQKDVFIILSIYIPAIIIELVIMIFLAIALVKTKNRIAIYFVIGSSLAWLSMAIAIIRADPSNSLVPQMSPFKYTTPAIGFVLESLVFAMVLSYRARINEIEKKNAQEALIGQLKENKSLQEKVNRELEGKVIERTAEIQIEKLKTERLLLNVLPESVVNEMKDSGTSVPKKFDNVSVLFADFVGFTEISSTMKPEDLVEKLNLFFAQFDGIMKKYGLEKIKTIGDAYLAVCGLPEAIEDHAIRSVKAAQDMIDFLHQYNIDHPNDRFWQMRIGINSGEVVAGVIGDYKFSYDIWGDTVNMASRLETNSELGKINISESTFQHIKHAYNCLSRGEIELKNEIKLQMYFVGSQLN